MNYSKPLKFLIIGLVLLTLFVPNSSSESYELGKEVSEIEENYYFPMNMDGLDFNYEILITSNYEIDIVVLTDSEFDYCCSNDNASSISFTDSRSMSFTKEGSIIVPELEDGYVLILDNSDAVLGGVSPKGTAVIEITYFQLIDDLEYSFNILGFILGIIFIPLIILGGIDVFLKYGWTEKILNNHNIKKITLPFEKYKEKNPDKYFSRFPILSLLISINILWYFLSLIMGQYEALKTATSAETHQIYINMGANSIHELKEGNLFSLITCNFMHYNFQHLFGNIIGIYFLGDYVEKELGSAKFMSFVLFTGFCSSILSLPELVTSQFSTGGGASGVVFALIGMIAGQIIIEKIKNLENHCTYPDMRYFAYTVILQGIAFVTWLTGNDSGGTSHLGHLGGFLSGMSFGIFIINSENTIPRYEEMTVVQLKEILRGRNLPVSGAKNLLIERLNEFDMIPDGVDDKVEENLIDVEDNNEWRMNIKDILFSFEGRINRQIWWYSLILVGLVYGMLILVIEFAILRALLNSGFILSTLLLILYTPYYYTTLALTIKRLKDTDRGWEWGFLVLIGYIMSGLLLYLEYDVNNMNLGIAIIIMFFGLISLFVGLPIFIICGFYKGTMGPNQYGQDPLNSPGYINISDLNELFTTTISSETSQVSELRSFFSIKSKQIASNWENYKRNKEQRNLDDSNLTDYQKWIITHPILYYSIMLLICAISVSLIFAIV